MENQGVSGPPPAFMVGNLMEMNELRDKAIANDMECLSHDIVHRILPHYLQNTNIYGKQFVMWWGVEPRLAVSQPEVIKEMLYSHSYGKSALQQKGNKDFIGKGLLMANGEEWAHQRPRRCTGLPHRETQGTCKLYGGMHITNARRVCRYCERVFRNRNRRAFLQIGRRHNCTHRVRQQLRKGAKGFFNNSTHCRNFRQSRDDIYGFPGNRFLPTSFNREIKRRKKEVAERTAGDQSKH
ncbi:hypothetical protein KI387_007898, partial [Taxus chinensis]